MAADFARLLDRSGLRAAIRTDLAKPNPEPIKE
jgi:hypothetical protein